MKKEVIVYKKPDDQTSQLFEKLGTNIEFMNTKRNLKDILITSATEGEGKSWIASNLAVTYAQSGKKVILVDSDIRNGRLHNIFGVSQSPGLSNYLSGVGIRKANNTSVVDYIQETELENLKIVSNGDIPPNPLIFLKSAKMIQFLEEINNICDIAIFDGTPRFNSCRYINTFKNNEHNNCSSSV